MDYDVLELKCYVNDTILLHFRVCFDLGETNNNVISTVGKKSIVICLTPEKSL